VRGAARQTEEDSEGEREEDEEEEEAVPEDLKNLPLLSILKGGLAKAQGLAKAGGGGSEKPQSRKAASSQDVVPPSSPPASSNFTYPLLRKTADGSQSQARPPTSGTSRTEDLERLQKALITGSGTKGGAQVDFGNLVNLEILKLLEKKQSDGKKNKKPDSSSEEESGEEADFRRGVAKSIHTYHEHGKSMKKRPLRTVEEYVAESRKELGIEEGQPFQPSSVTKAIAWGDMNRNLHRFHTMESKVFHELLHGRADQAALQCVLNLRAVRQAQINEGSWKTAWALTHLEDPIFPRRFAGAERDLEIIAGYQRGLEELERKTGRTNVLKPGGKGQEKGGEAAAK
jgi:hypothetical protein